MQEDDAEEEVEESWRLRQQHYKNQLKQEQQRQQTQKRALEDEMQRQQQDRERGKVQQEERQAREKRQRQQREQLVHLPSTTGPDHSQQGPRMPGAGPLLPTMGGPIRPAPMPLHPSSMPSEPHGDASSQLLGGGLSSQLQGSPGWNARKPQAGWQQLPKTVVNPAPGSGFQISPHAVLSGGTH